MFTELFCKHSVNIPGGTGTSGRSVGYLQNFRNSTGFDP
eukprot:SAG11_NODE_40097_length_211_cov_11.410714_1_plen_38_part_01